MQQTLHSVSYTHLDVYKRQEEQMRDFQNIQTTLQESVVHYAKKTAEAGLDGVVCSAHEVAKIKEDSKWFFYMVK